MPKQQVNRTREKNDPAAFSDKPMLDERRHAGLRGEDKTQDRLTNFDQSKRGLQDDHDPNDIGQRSANKPGGVGPKDPQPETDADR
jgi:hypothetical protein